MLYEQWLIAVQDLIAMIINGYQIYKTFLLALLLTGFSLAFL